MKLFDLVKNFHNDESGAVTVDWVVLTAAVVALAIGILSTIDSATTELASEIGSRIADVDP